MGVASSMAQQCTFLVPCLQNTVPILLEIFSIQYYFFYRKDSCISAPFCLSFGPKIAGAAYTRDHSFQRE